MDKLFDYLKIKIVQMRVETCCFLSPVRLGLVIMAYFNLLVSVIYLIGIVNESFQPPLMKIQEAEYGEASPMLSTVAYCVEDSFTVVLLCGIHRDDTKLLKVYLVYRLLSIVAAILAYALGIMSLDLLNKAIIIFTLLYHSYEALLVRSMIVEIKYLSDNSSVEHKVTSADYYAFIRKTDVEAMNTNMTTENLPKQNNSATTYITSEEFIDIKNKDKEPKISESFKLRLIKTNKPIKKIETEKAYNNMKEIKNHNQTVNKNKAAANLPKQKNSATTNKTSKEPIEIKNNDIEPKIAEPLKKRLFKTNEPMKEIETDKADTNLKEIKSYNQKQRILIKKAKIEKLNEKHKNIEDKTVILKTNKNGGNTNAVKTEENLVVNANEPELTEDETEKPRLSKGKSAALEKQTNLLQTSDEIVEKQQENKDDLSKKKEVKPVFSVLNLFKRKTKTKCEVSTEDVL